MRSIGHEERDRQIENIFQECRDLARKKAKGYGTEDDSMANLRDFGILGVIIRMHDKMSRITNLFKSGMKTEEQNSSFEDNLKDIINYAAIVLIMHGEQKG